MRARRVDCGGAQVDMRLGEHVRVQAEQLAWRDSLEQNGRRVSCWGRAHLRHWVERHVRGRLGSLHKGAPMSMAARAQAGLPRVARQRLKPQAPSRSAHACWARAPQAHCGQHFEGLGPYTQCASGACQPTVCQIGGCSSPGTNARRLGPSCMQSQSQQIR